MRFVTVSERHDIKILPLPYLLECLPQPPPAAIRLEGHPVVLVEKPPGLGRIDIHGAERGIGKPAGRVTFDLSQETPGPAGGLTYRREWLAPLAWAIPGEHRLPGSGKIYDILRERLPGAA